MKNAIIIILLCIFCSPALSSTVICDFDTSRKGHVSSDLFYNNKNDAYLLLRFEDSRFDDTTDVVKLNGCKKISSGVTNKSNFDSTLRGAGYKYVTLPSGIQREITNALYGSILINTSGEKIRIEIKTTPADRLQQLQSFQDAVKLKKLFSEIDLNNYKNDKFLRSQMMSDFVNPEYHGLSLSIDKLFEQWFGYEELVSQFKNDPSRIFLTDAYRSNIKKAIQYAEKNSQDQVQLAIRNLVSDSKQVITPSEKFRQLVHLQQKLTDDLKITSPFLMKHVAEYALKSNNTDDLIGFFKLNGVNPNYAESKQLHEEAKNIVFKLFEAEYGKDNHVDIFSKFSDILLNANLTSDHEFQAKFVDYALDKNNFQLAKKMYAFRLKGNNFHGLDWYRKYETSAIKFGDFYDAYDFAETGNIEAIKIAYAKASNDIEKIKIEQFVVSKYADKIFTSKIIASGNGIKSASGGSTVGRIFGHIGAEATLNSKIFYSLQVDRTLFNPNFDYLIDATILFNVDGRKLGWTACGLLWASQCDFDDPSSKSYPKNVNFKISSRDAYYYSDNIQLDWTSITSGKAGLMGGVSVFRANSVNLKFVINKVTVVSKQ